MSGAAGMIVGATQHPRGGWAVHTWRTAVHECGTGCPRVWDGLSTSAGQACHERGQAVHECGTGLPRVWDSSPRVRDRLSTRVGLVVQPKVQTLPLVVV